MGSLPFHLPVICPARSDSIAQTGIKKTKAKTIATDSSQSGAGPKTPNRGPSQAATKANDQNPIRPTWVGSFFPASCPTTQYAAPTAAPTNPVTRNAEAENQLSK